MKMMKYNITFVTKEENKLTSLTLALAAMRASLMVFLGFDSLVKEKGMAYDKTSKSLPVGSPDIRACQMTMGNKTRIPGRRDYNLNHS